MNKYINTCAALLFFQLPLMTQQTVDDVVEGIKKNNTTLAALRESVNARKIENRTGIYLQDPEIEFNYLWGTPRPLGSRTDISVKQSFDFPTAYRYRNQISGARNQQAELEYQKQLKSIVLEARLICIELTYTNILKSALERRVLQARNIANAYKLKLDAGETSILDYNKSRLNLLNVSNDLKALDIEIDLLLSALTRLNGGILIDFTGRVFQEIVIPGDFDQWYSGAEQNNPLLSWIRTEIETSYKQVSLQKALRLPTFQVGYMSESVTGQDFQGVTFGLSIPLWENKNKVKFAEANAIALESIEIDNRRRFHSQLQSLHGQVIALQNNLNNYRVNLDLFDNSELLLKALEKGEISLINYLVELSIYHESLNKLHELERDLHKKAAELNQYN